MSKRLMLLLLAAAMVMVAQSAFAVLPPAHQASNNNVGVSGDCAACHIPHKAPAIKRGFPQVNPTLESTYGYIGGFCMERCHYGKSAGTPGGHNMAAADTQGTVYTANFGGGPTGALVGPHGINLPSGSTRSPAGTVVSAALPYGDGARNTPFECTTCHNVHADTFGDTALLQADMDVLCIRCHINRAPAGFTDTWGNLYGAGNTIGSHPVGLDVNNDSDATPNSGIRVGIGTGYGATAFDVAYTNPAYGPTGHNLGGHLFNGVTGQDLDSPLSCVTCHMVHGYQIDTGNTAQSPTALASFSEDLIVGLNAASAVGAMGATDPGRHANGNGDENNKLCEGCHSYNATAAGAWNPGANPFSHPVDVMATSVNMGNIQTTAAAGGGFWPFGIATGRDNIGMGPDATGGGPRVLCESCHVMHPAANATEPGEDWANVPATGTHLLRRTDEAICGVCHIGTPPGHHPAGVSEAPTTQFSTGSAIDDDADAVLNCGDCHGGAGAHNWPFLHMPGLKPGWAPNAVAAPWNALVSDNGRSLYEANGYGQAPTINPGGAIIAYANASLECVRCHTTAGILNPTAQRNGGTTYQYVAPNGRYQNWGYGTHFLGETTDTFMENGLYLGVTPFNAEIGDWNPAANLYVFSRYAGTEALPQVVCESCHTLRITSFPGAGADTTLKANAGKLLVANYIEGASTQNTGSRQESGLCEGCHNRTWGGNTHLLTGDTVDRRSRVGLSNGPLSTASTNLASQGVAPGDCDYIGGQAGNSMNCDSCHQPHDANTSSGTMILDTRDDRVGVAPPFTSPRNGTVNLYTSTISRSLVNDHTWGKAQSAGNAADSFCSQCHNW